MRFQTLHLNCGWLHAPPSPPACCHCILIRSDEEVVLVDSGIGLHDVNAPEERIGPAAIQTAGFRFIPELTAVRQLQTMGLDAGDVTDIVLTHCDPDHIGGLADFPNAKVHVSVEEKANLASGNPRYSLSQVAHEPRWVAYGESSEVDWYGIGSRPVNISPKIDIRLLPLFGHTLGHCGVAIANEGRWLVHTGDAYYLRAELENEAHPVSSTVTDSS